jgi:hypothetical protein
MIGSLAIIFYFAPKSVIYPILFNPHGLTIVKIWNKEHAVVYCRLQDDRRPQHRRDDRSGGSHRHDGYG